LPFIARSATAASSSFLISTNPNPRERPSKRSRTIFGSFHPTNLGESFPQVAVAQRETQVAYE